MRLGVDSMIWNKLYLQEIARENKKSTLVVDDFSGGLNNRTDMIQDNESPYVLNMRYDETKGFTKRFGTELYDNLDLPDPVVWIGEYKPYNATDELVRATKNALYVGDRFIKTLAGEMSAINYNGYLLIADGGELYVYGDFPNNGNTYNRIIGTATTGNSLFKIVSPPADYVPLDNQHVQGVTVWNYTSSIVHYEPCELEIADTYKGANVVPTSVQYVTQHKGRLYVSGSKEDDDNVFITDLQSPFYFPVFLPLQLPPNSDKVRGLGVFDDAVIVSRELDMYAIRGNTTRNDVGLEMFNLQKINVHAGFANNNSHDVAHNYLFYVGADGQCYALMNASSSDNLSTTLLSRQIDFLKEPFYMVNMSEKEPLKKEDVVKAQTYFFENDWHVAIGDYIALYNYETRAWSLYSGLQASSFYHKDYKLMIGRADGRTTIFTPNNYLDLGEPYLATWWSKRFDLGDPLMFKHFRDFFISLYPYKDFASDVRITILIDGREFSVIDIARSMISRYGKAQWGDMYITADMVVQIPFYINMRGRFIQFKISNAWDVAQEVFEYGDLTSVGERRFHETLAKTTSDDKYYLFTRDGWVEKTEEDLNQPLKFIQLAGEYELRRRRW